MSSHAEQKSIFVIVPAYNEQETIGQVTEELAGCGYTVVLVDDGSQPALSLPLQTKPLYHTRHSINLGQGAGLQTGISIALDKGARILVTFDADGQHAVGDIALMVEHLEKKQLDVVFGSRFLNNTTHNMSRGRKLVLQLARYINLLFTGMLLSDAHNGLRVMTAAAAGKIRIRQNGMSHATEILSQVKKLGLKYEEVPVHIFYTEYSKQKGQSAFNSFRILFDLLLNKLFR